MNIYVSDRTPYTYFIGWSKLNVYYYGVRYAEGCHPGEFWKSYFTSSDYVADFIKQHGDPDIREIRQLFNDVTKARLWETRVLKRMKVIHRDDFLNRTNNIAIAPMPGKENPMYGVKRPEGLMSRAGKAGVEAQKRLIETDPEYAKLHEQRQAAFREAGRKALSKREDGTSVSSDMVANGTHNFLGGEIQRKTHKRRLENGTHHLLGGAQQRQQLANGLHPSQIKISCVECRKVLSGVANLNQHTRGSKCKKYHE